MEFLLISLFISKNGTIQCTQKSNKLLIFFLKKKKCSFNENFHYDSLEVKNLVQINK